jgi:putative transposase
VFILKQSADGHLCAEICPNAGSGEATYFNWKEKRDGLLPDEIQRLKQLEDESVRPKKLRKQPKSGDNGQRPER